MDTEGEERGNLALDYVLDGDNSDIHGRMETTATQHVWKDGVSNDIWPSVLVSPWQDGNNLKLDHGSSSKDHSTPKPLHLSDHFAIIVFFFLVLRRNLVVLCQDSTLLPTLVCKKLRPASSKFNIHTITCNVILTM